MGWVGKGEVVATEETRGQKSKVGREDREAAPGFLGVRLH